MASRIGAYDWSATALGPIDRWAPQLKALVQVILGSSEPMFIAWGPQRTLVYNDPYAQVLASKHPALGQNLLQVWHEIRAELEPLVAAAYAGVPTRMDDIELVMERKGYRERTHWHYSYTPVRLDDGVVGGFLCACHEITQQIDAERLASSAQLEQAKTALALDALTANAPIGFAFFDREHRYTQINAVLAEINGIPVERHLGRTVEELLPVNAQSVVPVLERVFATGKAVAGFEINGETPASPGEPRSWLTGFFPVFAPDGSVTRVGATVVDITDRKRAEAELRINEERLRLATENAEVGFWDVDEVNERLHWPPIVKAMFGISPNAPVTMQDFYDGLHPEDRDATAAAYAAAADPGRRALYDVEYRTVGKEDGLIRWVAAKGRGVFDMRDRCLRVLGTAMDVTRRKVTEEQLRDLNETLERRVSEAISARKLLADVVDGTDLFVQVANLDYDWLAINRAASREFSRIFGVPEPKAGDNMLSLLRGMPDQQAAVRQVWSRALAGEEFVQVTAFGDPSIDRRYYEMRFRSLCDPAGRVVGAYQFVADVTERLREQQRLKETEAALAQAQKMEAVGQLTGGIAHDFNNVLQSVAGNLDLIHRAPTDVERVKRWAKRGFDAAHRGTKLTAQLLAFSREQKLEVKPVVLSELVSAFREVVDRTIGAHITIKLDLKTDGIRVLGDQVQIETAVLNLALNARDAMPAGGALTISTRAVRIEADAALTDGDYVELAVRDTGEGMPPAVIARAFDPFFTTKGVGKGTGLGLSQVYGAMRQAGGTARIESAAGAGTTVRLLFRRTHALAPSLSPEEVAPQTRHFAARVLVIDDDAEVRQFLVDSLDALGFAVIQAEDGDAGLAQLERGSPDLMIVDFAMPGLNGAEVAKRARERRPDMPIIFASGFAESAVLDQVVQADVPVLRKPFGIADLQRVLEAAWRSADRPRAS